MLQSLFHYRSHIIPFFINFTQLSEVQKHCSMLMFMVDVLLWLVELLTFNHTRFDAESGPEGEAPEEVQTLRLQQDVSEWLVCLNMLLSLFICVVTVTTM